MIFDTILVTNPQRFAMIKDIFLFFLFQALLNAKFPGVLDYDSLVKHVLRAFDFPCIISSITFRLHSRRCSCAC